MESTSHHQLCLINGGGKIDNYKTYFNSKDKLWSGPEQIVQRDDLDLKSSVGKLLYSSMKENAHRICQISDSQGLTFTYGEALTMSIRIAQNLMPLGLHQDDIIGIMASNTAHLLPVVIACFLNCTTFHVISPASGKDAVTHLLGITKPKVVICDGKSYETVAAVCRESKLSAMIFTMKDHVKGVARVLDLFKATGIEHLFEPAELIGGATQTAAIVCSSGTTGLPKGVCISNERLLGTVRRLSCDDVTFSFSSLDWYSGLHLLVISLLIGLTRIVTDNAFTPELMLMLIEKYKITYTMVSPSHLAQMVKCADIKFRTMSSLKMLVCCGGSVPVAILLEAQKHLTNGTLINLYGTTEFGAISTNRLTDGRPDSVGQLGAKIKVKIVDENCKRLGVGCVGEIQTFNGRFWQGYYNNLVDTDKLQDSEGWFHTGDLGYFDEEGNLFVVDRIKDILKFQSIHYSSHEIEGVIAELPGVVEVCVFGIHNDIDMDRAAAAIVRQSYSTLSEKDVMDYVSGKLPYHMHLHGGAYLLDALPKTTSGKVIRNQTRDIVLKQISKRHLNKATGIAKY